MNSALSHNLSTTICRIAPAFKLNGDETSRRLLAILFPVPTITIPTAPVAPPPAPNFAFNPTLTKKFVQIAGELACKNVEGARTSFLDFVNALPVKEYGAKAPLEHMREFLKPKPSNAAAAPAALPKVVAPPPTEIEVDENCVAVMWKGKEYWVGEDSKRVYEETADGVNEFRGMLGLAEFDGMEMPVDEV